MKPTSDLLQIARAGASLTLPMGSKPTSDLLQIARALEGDAKLTLVGTSNDKPTSDLLQIARAGKVHFVFN
ncbi:hypothetical protein [Desulfovibrio desulfuricans]|uniref:hypothetical protein n=1 Tax=Desulfovibrio desulfuricans TaxID=876 RepID=UPI001C00F4D6|nr:hypothetical protein [Desulfovibrio desulfuricans]MBT9747968.1 hypothetical protein [Desulfovibrio desulfuricans]